MISIHAPARGATRCKKRLVCFKQNFNPRSREGSDSVFFKVRSFLDYFNPRSREGSDSGVPKNNAIALKISIHAPARGATFVGVNLLNVILDFNPRSREGSDNFNNLENAVGRLFQSTLPRGERRFSGKHISTSKLISIHAPARGATARLSI